MQLGCSLELLQVLLGEEDFRRKANHKSGRPLNDEALPSHQPGTGRSLQQSPFRQKGPTLDMFFGTRGV